MKKILILGAGKSASVLISHLLSEAEDMDWEITVGDADINLAREKTGSHCKGIAIEININEAEQRRKLVENADLVISMMPPALHLLVAKDCVAAGKHLLTASYAGEEIKALDAEAKEKGVLILCEMGLDPGIDHMSAMKILHNIKAEGGVVSSFRSHCGGLVAPESDDNPWHYKISWNPRNIVMAGKAGARYRENGVIKEVAYENLFDNNNILSLPVKGMEKMGYYANRDSISYIDLYGLDEVTDFVRTTLRHPDFMYGWKNVVDLQLTDESKNFQSDEKSLYDFFLYHMKKHGFSEWLEEKLHDNFEESEDLLKKLISLIKVEDEAIKEGEEIPENLMIVNETGNLENLDLDTVKYSAAMSVAEKMYQANLTLKQLLYLGMDDDKTMINKGKCSSAEILQLAMEKNLALSAGDKDMIIMYHEIDYENEGEQKHLKSCLSVKGDNSINTAMAKTVGLPLGIAASLILRGKINLTGVQIPILPEIYEPVMAGLEKHGIIFSETIS